MLIGNLIRMHTNIICSHQKYSSKSHHSRSPGPDVVVLSSGPAQTQAPIIFCPLQRPRHNLPTHTTKRQNVYTMRQILSPWRIASAGSYSCSRSGPPRQFFYAYTAAQRSRLRRPAILVQPSRPGRSRKGVNDALICRHAALCTLLVVLLTIISTANWYTQHVRLGLFDQSGLV